VTAPPLFHEKDGQKPNRFHKAAIRNRTHGMAHKARAKREQSETSHKRDASGAYPIGYETTTIENLSYRIGTNIINTKRWIT